MSVANDPATRGAVVTPSDTVVIGAAKLYVGGTGDVAVMFREGDTPVVFKSVAVGVLPVAAYRVMATGTTATNIVALY